LPNFASGCGVHCLHTPQQIGTSVPPIDYHLLVDTTPALLFSARADGYVDYFNQRWLDRLGATVDALRGMGWTQFIHPDDVEEHVRRWQTAIATGNPAVSQARVRLASGEYRWMLHHTEPVRDESGAIAGWAGSSIDIEDLKRAEHELHDLKEQLRKENIALRDEIMQTSMFEEIIGASEPLRRVLVLVEKVAGTDSTVLITGETGTGKELIARAIHKRSKRAPRPFVSVNCGAIAPALINSELFGHEKGAFTGALQRHLGRFELAEGGTLFLDEVGELPHETQIALLRVLQERTFERVGGTKPVPANVRVITATNRDLDAAIDDGSFRRDLFYRLSVFPIHVPPLRERREDIPLLVEYLTQRYASKIGKKLTNVSRRTMDRLRAYDWPGNIRELQNVIQRAVILSEGTLEVDEAWLAQGVSRPPSDARRLGRPSLREEKEWIESALAESRGLIAGPDGAAAKLGIPRSTLESRIRSLRIDKYRFKSVSAALRERKAR
jgi:formate hydrogenlyase transcriptional activator